MGIALLAIPIFPRPAAAIDTPFAAVEVAPARVELAVTGTGPVTSAFNVANLSTTAEVVTIQQVDFTVVNDAYQVLPVRATPWSIAAGLVLTSTRLTLAPKSQAVVGLTYTPLSQVAVRAGALLFTPTVVTSTSPVGMTVAIVEQVMVPILAVPSGSDGRLDSRVHLAGRTGPLDLLSVLSWGGISFQEPGTIQARSTWTNAGNAIGRWDVWTTWANLGQTYAQVESPPAVSLPGQTVSVTADTAVDVDHHGRVELTPTFGIVTVHAEGRLVLLGQSSDQLSTGDRLVIVAPWRILGLVLAIVVFAWWGRQRLLARRRD